MMVMGCLFSSPWKEKAREEKDRDYYGHQSKVNSPPCPFRKEKKVCEREEKLACLSTHITKQ